jgi:hypothetical protein
MREIEDNRVFFIAAAILVVIFGVSFGFYQFYDAKYYGDFIVGFGSMISIPVTIGICAMGAAQMYWDKTKKISALLATLAVNRGQIFTARVIAGILLVIIGFVPLAVTIITSVSSRIGKNMPISSGLYLEMLIPLLLFEFACYCIGLQTGWTSNKVGPTLGALGLSVILIPAILIKGFGWEIYAILVLFIAVSLIRAWHKFSSAAL